MATLLRCDICGRVQLVSSASVEWANGSKGWGEFNFYDFRHDYCPECAEKVEAFVQKMKDATPEK